MRRLKAEYLSKLKEVSARCDENEAPNVTSLPTKPQGRPLMLGKVLDTAVQDYVTTIRAVGGVVNTSICMAAAEGIVAARDQGLLAQHGGHIELTKTWARSLLTRMGMLKGNAQMLVKLLSQTSTRSKLIFLLMFKQRWL